MSDVSILAALETRLSALSPSLESAHENTTFETTPDTPYQRVNFLPNTPLDATMGRKVTQFLGLFQVTVCYPLGNGSGDARARAEAIRDHFAPCQTLSADGINVQINDTPRIASGYVDGDRYCIPVTVPWYAWIART